MGFASKRLLWQTPMLRRMLATTNDLTFTIARLVLGVTFFIHGAQKMLGWFGGFGLHVTTGSFLQLGIPAPLAFLAICAEFFGGFALIVGLFTRFAGEWIVGCGELIYDHVFVASAQSVTYYGSRGGGSVFNLLANVAALGGKASAVGVAGRDTFGDAARAELQTLGVSKRPET